MVNVVVHRAWHSINLTVIWKSLKWFLFLTKCLDIPEKTTQPLSVNSSASPTNSWEMYLVIFLDSPQTYFMNILTSESLISKSPNESSLALLFCLRSIFSLRSQSLEYFLTNLTPSTQFLVSHLIVIFSNFKIMY